MMCPAFFSSPTGGSLALRKPRTARHWIVGHPRESPRAKNLPAARSRRPLWELALPPSLTQGVAEATWAFRLTSPNAKATSPWYRRTRTARRSGNTRPGRAHRRARARRGGRDHRTPARPARSGEWPPTERMHRPACITGSVPGGNRWLGLCSCPPSFLNRRMSNAYVRIRPSYCSVCKLRFGLDSHSHFRGSRPAIGLFPLASYEAGCLIETRLG